MDSQKFFLRSARVWASITGILGILMPYVGLDPTEGIPLLEKVGQQGLAMASAVLALVHFIRPSGQPLKLKPILPTDVAATGIVFVALFGVLFTGCMSYNGAAYATIAQTEVSLLDPGRPITNGRCAAHDLAADALEDETGDQTALYVPLGSAPAIDEQANLHRRQAAVCRAQVVHEDSGAMTDTGRSRTVLAWERLYTSGLKLVGGE